MKHQFHFTHVPVNPADCALPDGAITGNGDLSLIWAGEPDRLKLHISKCDFWHAIPGDRGGGGISPIGWIEIGMPLASGSDYDVVQDMDRAEITGHFAAAHTRAEVRTVVCAVDNIILLEVEVTRPGTSVDVSLMPCEGCGSTGTNMRIGDIQLISRKFDDERVQFVSEAWVSCREVSRTCRTCEDGRRTELLRYAVSVATNHDSGSCRRIALQKAIAIENDDFDELLQRHAQWWKEFWAKSSLSLPDDEELENHWYAGLYVMAVCARNQKFPPGLWGNFCMRDDMPWQGDYHLNYNFQAPYYGLPSANHIELMDSFDKPIEDFMPFAHTFARKFTGCRGVYFPVGIGPMGLDTSCIPGTKEHGILFLGQKTNAAFCATVIAMRWYAARDSKYAREHGYPFLKEAAAFWEDYLVYEDGRYVDYNDSIHEVEYYSGPDFRPARQDEVNSVIALGLIAMTFQCLLDMRKELGIDEDKVEKWEHILSHLSVPVYYEGEDGREYIRATEEGTRHTALLLQYVYPAGRVGSRSDKRLLNAMRNVFEISDEWVSDNRFCTFYPTAARLGICPDRITDGMHRMIRERGLGNGLFRCGGGGIENNSAIVSTLDDMLLQSFEGILRFFPTWNPGRPAAFQNLRADGAFLVSAELEDGMFAASIFSEKGSVLSVEKPAFGNYCLVKGNQKQVFGDEEKSVITVNTAVGETIYVKLCET